MNRQIFELGTTTPSLTKVFPFQDAAGSSEAQQNTLQTLKDLIMPYKVYRAYLSQSGTADPVATVIENTLGGTLVWARAGAGEYTATLSGAFTANKTFIPVGRRLGPNSGSDLEDHAIFRTSANVVTYFTNVLSAGSSTLTDSILLVSSVEIYVYF